MNASVRDCGLVPGRPATGSRPGLQARAAVSARHPGPARTAALGVAPSSPRPQPGTVPSGHPRSSAQLEGSPGLQSLLPGASGKRPCDSGSLLGSGAPGPAGLGNLWGPGVPRGGGAGGALWPADQHPLTLACPFVPPIDHHAWDEERLRGRRSHPGGLQSRCEAGERGPIAAVLGAGGSPPSPEGPPPSVFPWGPLPSPQSLLPCQGCSA